MDAAVAAFPDAFLAHQHLQIGICLLLVFPLQQVLPNRERGLAAAAAAAAKQREGTGILALFSSNPRFSVYLSPALSLFGIFSCTPFFCLPPSLTVGLFLSLSLSGPSLPLCVPLSVSACSCLCLPLRLLLSLSPTSVETPGDTNQQPCSVFLSLLVVCPSSPLPLLFFCSLRSLP